MPQRANLDDGWHIAAKISREAEARIELGEKLSVHLVVDILCGVFLYVFFHGDV